MEIVVSAPGKVILHGEHAVVYGKPAIAASLGLRSYISLMSTEDNSVSVQLPAVGFRHSWTVAKLQDIADVNHDNLANPVGPTEEVIAKISQLIDKKPRDLNTTVLKQALTTFIYLYAAICPKDRKLPSMKVSLFSKLPVGAGLGSSASFSVCVSAALLLYHKLISAPAERDTGFVWEPNDLELINKWAFQGEKIIHGTPSGIDNSIATFGGAIKFQGGQITRLKLIPRLRVLLTNTKIGRSTKLLVAGVKDKTSKFPKVMEPILDATGAAVDTCEKILDSGMKTDNEYSMLEELIDINQGLLQAMGVSHVTLEKICHVTSKYSLHSKLTGAGGGGCAFTLLRPNIEEEELKGVIKDLEAEGFTCFETEVGSEGVLVHDSLPLDMT